ncbi:GNAT family N-acetyltransferase [Tepidicaulis sp. LMO-SS28]|uniref:GNAT family N-acetyltransferase n=1 Tax=Tepidicaulis sp. LMO-SS28 TaxID=3447455 RepID=UPI003EE04D9B
MSIASPSLPFGDITTRLMDISEHEAAERLWYQVYVQEMGREQSGTDHSRRIVKDSLQSFATLIGAYANRQLIGTVRANLMSEGDIGYYYDLYGLDDPALRPKNRCAITTRIMVQSEYRSSNASLKLATSMFRHLKLKGVKWIMCDCNEPVLAFFMRLGFAVHKDNAKHPDYGNVYILKLNALDPKLDDPRRSLLARFSAV